MRKNLFKQIIVHRTATHLLSTHENMRNVCFWLLNSISQKERNLETSFRSDDKFRRHFHFSFLISPVLTIHRDDIVCVCVPVRKRTVCNILFKVGVIYRYFMLPTGNDACDLVSIWIGTCERIHNERNISSLPLLKSSHISIQYCYVCSFSSDWCLFFSSSSSFYFYFFFCLFGLWREFNRLGSIFHIGALWHSRHGSRVNFTIRPKRNASTEKKIRSFLLLHSTFSEMKIYRVWRKRSVDFQNETAVKMQCLRELEWSRTERIRPGNECFLLSHRKKREKNIFLLFDNKNEHTHAKWNSLIRKFKKLLTFWVDAIQMLINISVWLNSAWKEPSNMIWILKWLCDSWVIHRARCQAAQSQWAAPLLNEWPIMGLFVQKFCVEMTAPFASTQSLEQHLFSQNIKSIILKWTEKEKKIKI